MISFLYLLYLISPVLLGVLCVYTILEKRKIKAKFDTVKADEELSALLIMEAKLEERIKVLNAQHLEKIDDVKQRMWLVEDLKSELNSESKEVKSKVKEVLNKCIKNEISFLKSRMTPNNYAASKTKMIKFFQFLEKKGISVEKTDQSEILNELKEIFEKVVANDFEKKEQSRIKSRIREEQKLQREIDSELKRIALEKQVIEKALAKALKEAHGEHNAEIELLQEKLQEAEEKNQRAISQAQLTRAGYIYVVSNIGAFGGDVFKIGMTRRLEPLDRVKELSDASVPFAFDVHMMISCDDAPTLEKNLHRAFDKFRVNKVNFRKEFCRVELSAIVNAVKDNHGEVEYQVDPEALEYRQSMEMTDDDLREIEEVFEQYSQDEED